MKTVAIIQARVGSTRLPNKIFADLAGLPALGWVVRAAAAIPGVDTVAVATSTAPGDDAVAEWCASQGVSCHRGPEQDVLARYALAIEAERADVVLRLTGDCPFLDPVVCGQVLALLTRTGADYATNQDPASWPDGLDCEVATAAALLTASHEAVRPSEREHVTPFLRNNRHRFRVRNLTCPLPGLTGHRWTLDDARDLAFLRAVAERLPAGRPPSHLDVLAVLDREPELAQINAGTQRDEGFAKSLADEIAAGVSPVRSNGYVASQTLVVRAERTIPLASQTFSKSRIQYPEGASPLFLTHGQGGRVWDVDGNEYVDLVCGLLPVVLGYRDADVDRAIREQLDDGISFSLATTLEAELAERLVDVIPCAEMVRFGKNGTDATSAAVRLSRAFTGRDRILVCGYHGWQDWYIGTTVRHKGVPKAVRELSSAVPYNDLDAVRRAFQEHPGEIAALVLEPMNAVEPFPGYLAELKALVNANGALLVFDEVITGFRYHLGGAQALFGVTPDVASFGKALGNGMPISAVVGRADVMREMEEVFFSGTFGGETLSLAAGIAVVDKMRREPVIDTLWRTGAALADGVRERIKARALDGVFSLVGKAPWMILAVQDQPTARKEAIKTLLVTELLAHGVLLLGSHNVCYAHDAVDTARVFAAYDAALDRVAEELETCALEERLGRPAIESVFRVR
ncbi:aminotransferase class III-fold pyridoxal phosphate-dependent enzyme [Azospirillum soli]|uniref:aminotransferase class III-fold pyridoxal phosphate-dependent enzyme n=1 Tax=Azospirillum soli TaxID=1304799 RepID=UPI001AE0EEF2|nr:aminotransferase class III-fold pyridoxal phosphate-dependent enzyme [Azospirillum soli]MBP2316824.1 glutamate-1-semialdehyde 2,1-aminomutase/spore coat polysaccharide biosynthesis protein SpsF [Azospirillum soli]